MTRDNNSERDSLMRLPAGELQRRVDLAEAIIMDGIKESASTKRIKEIIRQRDVLVQVLKDKVAGSSAAIMQQKDGVVIKMNPLVLKLRRC